MTKRRCRHFDPREAGAAISLRSDRGVVTSGGFVDSWASTVGGVVANGSGTQRPAFSASSSSFGGFPALTFDGSNDVLDLSTTASALFQNVGQGIVLSVCQDTNSGGGASFHPILLANTPANLGRVRLDSMASGTPGYVSRGRRLDSDLQTPSGIIGSGSGVVVAEGEFQWVSNFHRAANNGVFGTSATFSSGAGNTSNTAGGVFIGGDTSGNRFPGPIVQVTAFNTAIDLALAARVRQAAAYAFNFACS